MQSVQTNFKNVLAWTFLKLVRIEILHLITKTTISLAFLRVNESIRAASFSPSSPKQPKKHGKMVIYKDIISGDEMFSDNYKIKDDEFIIEVQGKMIGPPEKSQEVGCEVLEGPTVSGVDIVLNHKLQERGFDKTSFLSYIKKYMKTIKREVAERSHTQVTPFKKRANEEVNKILRNFNNYKFYTGESKNTEGMVGVLDFRGTEDGMTPFMIFFKNGLGEEKILSRPVEHSNAANPLVYLTVAADNQRLGHIIIELFANVVPQTAENFRALCTGELGYGFQGSVFFNVQPGHWCRGGDITNQDGTGGRSIYNNGAPFPDETFLRHTPDGLLAMGNTGRNTNRSEFYITLTKLKHLDKRHVVFGWVLAGMAVVRQMGALGTKNGRPSQRIVITGCGQLP